jgi:hypothetical protein
MSANATTKRKNSGILRYTFGEIADQDPYDQNLNGQPGTTFNGQAFDSLTEGGTVRIVCCLGNDLDLTPDVDNQVFGASAGNAAVTGNASSLFTGSNISARAYQRIGPSPDYTVANGYIPGGTKVHAYFVSTNAIESGADLYPFIIVQTEVTETRIRRGSPPVADFDGPVLLGSIRVALVNQGVSESIGAGVLIVELQHSEHDIPGNSGQGFQQLASAPPG